jgi:hypothetical protein
VVFEVVVQLAVAPLLVGAATVAARWWGHGLGGLVSAFPAIVGPVLLIGAHRHGTEFAAQAATGTLLGLAALSGFALAYGRTALRAGWPVSLAAGWAVAAATAALAGAVGATLLGALATAVASVALAHRALPRAALPMAWLDPPRGDLALRMALTALVVFCALVAGLVEHAGVAATFVAATGAAIVTQGAVVWASTRRGPGHARRQRIAWRDTVEPPSIREAWYIPVEERASRRRASCLASPRIPPRLRDRTYR